MSDLQTNSHQERINCDNRISSGQIIPVNTKQTSM